MAGLARLAGPAAPPPSLLAQAVDGTVRSDGGGGGSGGGGETLPLGVAIGGDGGFCGTYRKRRQRRQGEDLDLALPGVCRGLDINPGCLGGDTRLCDACREGFAWPTSHMRIYPQPAPADWETPIAAIAGDLGKRSSAF